jgi:hypothetical protein
VSQRCSQLSGRKLEELADEARERESAAEKT